MYNVFSFMCQIFFLIFCNTNFYKIFILHKHYLIYKTRNSTKKLLSQIPIQNQNSLKNVTTKTVAGLVWLVSILYALVFLYKNFEENENHKEKIEWGSFPAIWLHQQRTQQHKMIECSTSSSKVQFWVIYVIYIT